MNQLFSIRYSYVERIYRSNKDFNVIATDIVHALKEFEEQTKDLTDVKVWSATHKGTVHHIAEGIV